MKTLGNGFYMNRGNNIIRDEFDVTNNRLISYTPNSSSWISHSLMCNL